MTAVNPAFDCRDRLQENKTAKYFCGFIFFRTFVADYGFTEFLHIAVERGMPDGSLLAVGIPEKHDNIFLTRNIADKDENNSITGDRAGLSSVRRRLRRRHGCQ